MKDTLPRFYLFDRVIIVYSAGMTLLLLLIGRPLGHYLDSIVFYAGVTALVYVIGRYLDERRSRAAHVLRLMYPILLFTFLYRATGGTMFLVHSHFLDGSLTSFELSVFGVHPTIYIDRHWLNPWVTEILSACYFGYYFLIPVFMILVYLRRDYEVLKNAMAAICVTFFASYILFFLYPIEGPRWFFAEAYVHDVHGPLFRKLVAKVIEAGAVRGGCMPSSHFGVALVLLIYASRYYRRWLWVMLPLVTGLALGTVWGRFHYVSDVVVGGAIGLAATLVIWRLVPPRDTDGAPVRGRKEVRTHHAS